MSPVSDAEAASMLINKNAATRGSTKRATILTGLPFDPLDFARDKRLMIKRRVE